LMNNINTPVDNLLSTGVFICEKIIRMNIKLTQNLHKKDYSYLRKVRFR